MKKLAILGVLLLFAVTMAQAETIIYGGGQVLIGDEIGAGSVVGVGQQVSDRLIIWGNFDGSKGESVVDNGLAGFSVLSGEIVSSLNMGFFLTVEGGIGKVEGEDVQFSRLVDLGGYFDLSEDTNTKIWAGVGHSNLSGWSAKAGLSVRLDWK